MPRNALIYISVVIGLGALTIVLGFLSPARDVEPAQLLTYSALAVAASTLKVRLPGLRSTISVSFPLLLMSVADLNLLATVASAAVCGAVQCRWNARKKPSPLQMAFNMAALAISLGLAYQVPRWILGSSRPGTVSVLLAISACVYFASNTLLVSTVLSLLDGKPLATIWRQCYLWTFPYYLVGAALADGVVACGHTVGWKVSLLILPSMYLVYLFYRFCLERMTQTGAPAN